MTKKVLFDKDGQPFFRVSLRKGLHDKSFIDETLEANGYVKSFSVKVIIKREGFSERSFTRKVAYFVTELTYQIPNDLREFRQSWFYYHPEKGMESICVKSFSSKEGYCFSINPFDKDFLKAKTKPLRITLSEANSMIQNRQALGVFSEGAEGLEEIAV